MGSRIRDSKRKPFVLKLIITYKYTMGAIESISGLGLAGSGALGFIASRFIDPALITKVLVAGELSEDPTDLFANWIVSQAPSGLFHSAVNIGLILFFVGVIKIIIATALLLKSKRLHVLALLLVALLMLFSVLDLVLHTSMLRVFAVAIELLTLWYLAESVPGEFQISVAS